MTAATPSIAPPLLRLLPLFVMLPLLLWRIGSQGIWLYDEAHFLLVAHTIGAAVRGVLSGVPLAELAADIHRGGGAVVFLAKPGHIGMLALLGLLTGGITATKALLLSAACALGSCLVIVRIGELLFNLRSGVIAALLWATNPLAIAYGRSALGVASSVFFLLLAVWLLLLAREAAAQRRAGLLAALAGVAATVALTCHYNVAIVLGLVGLVLVSTVSWRVRLCGMAGFIGSFLLLEGALLLAAKVIQPVEPDFRSLLGELRWAIVDFQFAQPAEGTGAVRSIDGVRGYGADAFWYLLEINARGLYLLPILAIGGIALLRAKLSIRMLLLAMGVLPWILWSVYTWKVERVLLMTVPGLALASAAGLEALGTKLDRSARAAAVVGCLAVGLILSAPRIHRPESPYAQAVRNLEPWLKGAPQGSLTAASFSTTGAPLWKWYLGPDRLRRGLTMKPIDFSSFTDPQVIAVDIYTDITGHLPGGAEHWPEKIGVGLDAKAEGHRYGFRVRGGAP